MSEGLKQPEQRYDEAWPSGQRIQVARKLLDILNDVLEEVKLESPHFMTEDDSKAKNAYKDLSLLLSYDPESIDAETSQDDLLIALKEPVRIMDEVLRTAGIESPLFPGKERQSREADAAYKKLKAVLLRPSEVLNLYYKNLF